MTPSASSQRHVLPFFDTPILSLVIAFVASAILGEVATQTANTLPFGWVVRTLYIFVLEQAPLLLWIAVALWRYQKTRDALPSFFRLGALTFSDALIIAGALLFILFLSDFALTIALTVGIATMTPSVELLHLPWIEMGFVVIRAFVYAACIEEFLCRGALLGRLTARWGIRRGIVISALIFALLHLPNVASVALAVLMGTLLALVYVRTQSFIPGMVAHGLYNLMANLLPSAFIALGFSYEVITPTAIIVRAFLVLITLPFIIMFLVRFRIPQPTAVRSRDKEPTVTQRESPDGDRQGSMNVDAKYLLRGRIRRIGSATHDHI